MPNGIKLTYRMREVLRRLQRADESGRGVIASPTNGTLNALEKRGLVKYGRSPVFLTLGHWTLTEAGRAWK